MEPIEPNNAETIESDLNMQTKRVGEKMHNILAPAFLGEPDIKRLFLDKDRGEEMYPPFLSDRESAPLNALNSTFHEDNNVKHQHEKRAPEVYKFISDNLHPTLNEIQNIGNNFEIYNDLTVMHDVRLADFLLDPLVMKLWRHLNDDQFKTFFELVKEGKFPEYFTYDEEMGRLWEEGSHPTKKGQGTLINISVNDGKVVNNTTQDIEIDVPNFVSARRQLLYWFIPEDIRKGDPTAHPAYVKPDSTIAIDDVLAKLDQTFTIAS